MVKTRISEPARINRDLLVEALKIFGKRTLVFRRVTRTKDDFGQLSAISTVDVTFTGDLQYGLDLDQRYITTGIVEVGDGVLYLHPEELSPQPEPKDQIVDGNAVWEIIERVERPELDGDETFRTYRCKRRINDTDT